MLGSIPTVPPTIFLIGRYLANSRGGKDGVEGKNDPVFVRWFLAARVTTGLANSATVFHFKLDYGKLSDQPDLLVQME